MAVRTETELQREIERLRAELARQERESSNKERQLEIYAEDLRETFKQERARSQQLHSSYMATVRALSNAVEARDAYTGKHAERVAAYGMEISRAIGLRLADGHAVEFGFLLHDIGKVAIPDAILYKPGKLTEKERALMAQHPVIGSEIVRDIDFLGDATKVVRSHHERWDGSGYPAGLEGDQIPTVGRICAVCDVYDALLSRRSYKQSWTPQAALAEIKRGSGSHFDPELVDAFLRIAANLTGEIGAADEPQGATAVKPWGPQFDTDTIAAFRTERATPPAGSLGKGNELGATHAPVDSRTALSATHCPAEKADTRTPPVAMPAPDGKRERRG